MHEQNKKIDLKLILSPAEVIAVKAVKEYKTQKKAAKALNKERTTIIAQLKSARNRVKEALNSEEKITTNELIKML